MFLQLFSNVAPAQMLVKSLKYENLLQEIISIFLWPFLWTLASGEKQM